MTHHKNAVVAAFKSWLPFAIVIVIFAGLVYVAIQQNYRMSAYDPQIQNAEDIAGAVSKGLTTPDAIVSPNPTADIGDSLSVMAAVFSATGTPIGSSVSVNGKLPTLPQGIFDYAKQHGEERLTWQPQTGVRIAAVVTSFKGPNPGYVLVGRSLKEIELRINMLTEMTAAAALLALILTFLVLYFFASKDPQHHIEHAHTHTETTAV